MRSERAQEPRLWLDAVPEAAVITDANGVILDANAHCPPLFGCSPDELRGQAIQALIPDPPPRPAVAAVEEAAAGGQDGKLVQRGGRELPVRVSFHPISIDGDVVVVIRDARAERWSAETVRLKSLALEAAANGVIITDKTGKILWVNPAACAITGYSRDELVGSSPSLLKSGVHEPALYRDLWERVLAGETWHGALVNRRRDGSLYHEELTIAPMRDELGHITHFISITQDVTARVAAEQALRAARDELGRRVAEIEGLRAQLREQAVRDPLTGLFNRRYLDETLPRELAAANRDQQPVCLVMFDVDRFKQTNDQFGHPAGDQVLIGLGAMLREHSRASDIACRYGGEEFVVVLRGATLQNAVSRAEEWRLRFRGIEVDAGTKVFRSTVSAGVAEWHVRESAAEVLARADAALYRAKAAGRDRVIAADVAEPAAVAGASAATGRAARGAGPGPAASATRPPHLRR